MHRIKAIVGLAITLLAITFTSFFIAVITSIATAAGLLVILYFCLLGYSDEEEETKSGAPSGGVYNYATGEVDDGLEIGGLYEDE